MKRFCGLFTLHILLGLAVYPQEKFVCNGYLSNLGLVAFNSGSNSKLGTDMLNTRLNSAWYPNSSLSITWQLRNQFIVGDQVGQFSTVGEDRGLIDMAFGYSDKSFVWNLQIDRLFSEYTYKSWLFTVGRQRINWGRTLVWNPNDIFNSYSFYDFDYIERPGSDAIRVQHFTSAVSSVEIALQADSTNKANFGFLWRTNKWNTDFQFLTAYLSDNEITAGIGWEGNLGPVATRGEIEYYRLADKLKDTTGIWLTSLGFDYLAGSKLTLQFEFLYNDKKCRISDFGQLYQVPMSSKTLSFSEYNFYFGSVYQLSPLINLSLSTIYYTDQKGFFVMPSTQISLSDNFTLSFLYQYFNIRQFDQRFKLNFFYAGLKWNF